MFFPAFFSALYLIHPSILFYSSFCSLFCFLFSVYSLYLLMSLIVFFSNHLIFNNVSLFRNSLLNNVSKAVRSEGGDIKQVANFDNGTLLGALFFPEDWKSLFWHHPSSPKNKIWLNFFFLLFLICLLAIIIKEMLHRTPLCNVNLSLCSYLHHPFVWWLCMVEFMCTTAYTIIYMRFQKLCRNTLWCGERLFHLSSFP